MLINRDKQKFKYFSVDTVSLFINYKSMKFKLKLEDTNRNRIIMYKERNLNFEWREKRDPGSAERDEQAGKCDTIIDGRAV